MKFHNAYERHPLSALCGDMDASQLTELAEDIKHNGLIDDVVLLDGMVLDGWHRSLACRRVGAECRYVEFRGGDAAAFVESKNAHRRSYQKPGQRAAVIVALREWLPAHRPTSERQDTPEKGTPGVPLTRTHASNQQMADAAQVHKNTIKHAKAGERAGLGEAMRSGEVSPKAAAQLAKDPMLAQQVANRELAPAAAKSQLSEASPNLKKPTRLEAEQAAHAKTKADLVDLKARHAEVVEALEMDHAKTLPESEQVQKIEELLSQLHTVNCQFREEQRISAGLRTEVSYLRKQLKRTGL